jgi:hypothetical protein
VDRYLLKVGAFLHKPELSANDALEYLSQASQRPPYRELLDKGRRAYVMLRKLVLEK